MNLSVNYPQLDDVVLRISHMVFEIIFPIFIVLPFLGLTKICLRYFLHFYFFILKPVYLQLNKLNMYCMPSIMLWVAVEK